MARKRKRRTAGESGVKDQRAKRVKITGESSRQPNDPQYNYPVLPLYYDHVSSLRAYLLQRLPLSSKSSRRKIGNLGSKHNAKNENELATLLDSVVVGYFEAQDHAMEDFRRRELIQFSQTQSSSTATSTASNPSISQSEIVDFAIWTLFTRTYRGLSPRVKRPHLLCHGSSLGVLNGQTVISSYYPNQNVATLKNDPWSEVTRLLGSNGDGIMLGLLLDCGLFAPVETGKKNLCQISGIMLSEIPLRATIAKKGTDTTESSKKDLNPKAVVHRLNAITLPHSWIFYAKSTKKRKGQSPHGLPHSHVLNRYIESDDAKTTLHVMKYVFPRQFGLPNVFDDPLSKNQGLHVYMDRGEEISNAKVGRVPKRLRGEIFALISVFRRRHKRCPFGELLKHYCPENDVENKWDRVQVQSQTNPLASSGSRDVITQNANACGPDRDQIAPKEKHSGAHTIETKMMDYATPAASVSAFCRAVLGHLLPRPLLGEGADELKNWNKVMKSVDQFIRLRKKETLTLHDVCQGLKISSVAWLVPPKLVHQPKTSKSDVRKRTEIFHELVYYIFMSLLVPLIRSNFYVTESNVDSNRLFFFRHDTWLSLSKPSLASLKTTLFEEMTTGEAEARIKSRVLGYSQLRLLPKAKGARPILSFRKRMKMLGTSDKGANKLLEPVHSMLSYETKMQPSLLGSSMFSQGETYPKLKAYKAHLMTTNKQKSPLYFVKVDVKSCFDTIPQDKLVEFVRGLMSEESYRRSYHAIIQPPANGGNKVVKPDVVFKHRLQGERDVTGFYDVVNHDLAVKRKRAVFVESGFSRDIDGPTMLHLLGQHVQMNIVKIDQKYYRQKCGIPQGSILSSILCNMFYGEMEREKLGFLDRDSVLMRHTDDFLLITSNRQHATRFLQAMHDGHPDYGAAINPAKSLVNFEITINGIKIARPRSGSEFPYLGDLIHTQTLAISTDVDRRKRTSLENTLTVATSRSPGRSFTKKTLVAFTARCHARFFDTAFNTTPAVMFNLYQNFVLVAMKSYRYIKSLPGSKRPPESLVIKTIEDLIGRACSMIKSRRPGFAGQDFQCGISRSQVEWLAAKAFLSVLGRKQTKFPCVIPWLEKTCARCQPRNGGGEEWMKLHKATKVGAKAYQDFRY